MGAPDFADPVPVLIRELVRLGYQAGVSTPDEFSDTVPFVQVGQVGGGPEWGHVADSPTVDFTVYGRGYKTARQAALEVRRQVSGMRGKWLVGGLVLDRAHPVGPFWVDNPNPGVHEFLISFELSFRTQNTRS